MTPRELLTDVLTRFQVMYLTTQVQESLLKQALSTYQTVVGPTSKLSIADATLPVSKPAEFAEVAVCLDAEGRWHEADISASTVTAITTSKSVAPFTLHYFISLRNINLDTGALPDSSITLLTEYLYTLLAIPNTQRAREAMTVTGIQMELPDDNELNNRKTLLEEEMDESAAMIPMATVY